MVLAYKYLLTMSMPLFFFLLISSVCQSENHDDPIVQTPLGKIKGFRETSHGGRTFSAFEGIPFGKPPIGDRRFEAPEPVDPWLGTWDAKFPTICSQSDLPGMESETPQTEDCLHLNVYVPREQPNSKFELDVIVHIHGGAYMMGHGNLYCRPTFLMDHDVIFVTFNYRVGILGFLSTEDDVVSGNMGLKDQVLALKWIQNNIKYFGGNPNSVTLSGASAGGGSTHLHYFSDLSKGLFHRGFAQSGLALNPWSITENPLDNAKKLADAVGCPTVSKKAMIDCLKQRPDKQLLDKVKLFYKYLVLPIAPFGPVVEKSSAPFLKDLPYSLLIKNQVLDVPLIASHGEHEGTVPVFFFIHDLDNVNKNWLELAPFLLDFNRTLPRSKWEGVAQKIKDHYFGKGQDISQANLLRVLDLFGDRYFYVDAEDALLWQAAAVKSPIYYYRFSYLGDFNEQKIVGHVGDGKYYFGQDMMTPRNLTENEVKMADIMVKMLVSYAKTGVPTLRDVKWQPTDADQLSYVDIGGFESKDIKTRKTKSLTPREFWKSLGILENENIALFKDEL